MNDREGYRVVSLNFDGSIPDEVAEIHHFSDSLERSQWWAKTLPNEPEDYVPDRFRYIHNGYAIVEVKAEDVEDNHFFKGDGDYVGRIISSKVLEVHNYLNNKVSDSAPEKTIYKERKSSLMKWFSLVIIIILTSSYTADKQDHS